MEPGNGHERLRALDEAFLHLERVETPMHVGAVAILERAPFLDADGRFRLGDVRRLIASRMQLLPKFRQRVVPVPFGRGRAVWTDQEGFTVADHVHLTSLPEPGNPAGPRRARKPQSGRPPGTASGSGNCASTRASTSTSRRRATRWISPTEGGWWPSSSRSGNQAARWNA